MCIYTYIFMLGPLASILKLLFNTKLFSLVTSIRYSFYAALCAWETSHSCFAYAYLHNSASNSVVDTVSIYSHAFVLLHNHTYNNYFGAHVSESHVCLRDSVIQETISILMQSSRVTGKIHREIGGYFFGIHVGSSVPIKFDFLIV